MTYYANGVCGCNRLLLDNFDGVKNCKSFVAAYADWNKKYLKAIKGDKNV